jgi:hypothetical protein
MDSSHYNNVCGLSAQPCNVGFLRDRQQNVALWYDRVAKINPA